MLKIRVLNWDIDKNGNIRNWLNVKERNVEIQVILGLTQVASPNGNVDEWFSKREYVIENTK